MATYLITFGHGDGDPGAVGQGTNERDFNRNVLYPHLKRWSDKSAHKFEYYDITGNKDMFQDTAKGYGMYSIGKNQYASVTEIHEDAAGSTATGGHVIVSSSFKSDSRDLALAKVIQDIVGLWGGVSKTNGISYRSNLLNLNVAAQRGINYRLMELGFITNKTDMDKIKGNLDKYAKGIIEGITGENLGTTTVKPSDKPKEETPVVTINNNRPKHAVLTGKFDVGSAAATKVEDFIKNWNYRKIYSSDKKKVQFEIAKFNQYDEGKFRLEKWLAENNYSFEVTSNISEVTTIKTNNRQSHYILTGRFDKDTASYKLVKKYLTDNKWNFKEEVDKDKKVRFKTGKFNQASESKFRLERWLAQNNYSYQVLS